jgi:hypothetical protein
MAGIDVDVCTMACIANKNTTPANGSQMSAIGRHKISPILPPIPGTRPAINPTHVPIKSAVTHPANPDERNEITPKALSP